MTPSSDRELHDLLSAMPMHDRLVALAASIILDNPGAVSAVAAMISIAVMMGKRLSAPERAHVACHMKSEAEELAATWN